jgi:tetratricopeptide (TPR) repeat protein
MSVQLQEHTMIRIQRLASRKLAMGLVLGAALAAGVPPLHAADTPEPSPPNVVDPLAPARAHIVAKRWPAAINDLRKVNATHSADWNNLMGYSLRMQASPDLEGAQRHYDAALRIDPNHRGALAYSGELALMKSDLPVAEQRLESLAKICSGGCAEHDELKGAVARYKASGNRYVPGTGTYGS